MIKITGFPFPPSANELYANHPVYGRTKTKVGNLYEKQVKFWMYKNNAQLLEARINLKKLSVHDILIIDRIYYYEKKSIVTKDNRPKRNDTSNRIKALDDCLSDMLMIDDCYFFNGSHVKKISANGEKYVDIFIKPMHIDLALI